MTEKKIETLGHGPIKVLLLHSGPEYEKIMLEVLYTKHMCRIIPKARFYVAYPCTP